ncbi:B-box-type zinc finger [Dillenia turbinata]|uniref:B-box-type zinc finger n=1 Tax=Dillenia turbinata TaxID=194707 RepID=A0AAN8YYC0_9MAGN
MKRCELCESPAKMHCESDAASLCWECDVKVHTANFLVAKHNRILLCHFCQSPTPWSGSGPNLGSAISLCHTCLSRRNNQTSYSDQQPNLDNTIPVEENDDDDDEEVDGDENEENQVVPWLSSSSSSSVIMTDSEENTTSESTTMVDSFNLTVENGEFDERGD